MHRFSLYFSYRNFSYRNIMFLSACFILLCRSPARLSIGLYLNTRGKRSMGEGLLVGTLGWVEGAEGERRRKLLINFLHE